jgi:ferredoxin
MRFVVDFKTCDNHAQCALQAPDLFDLDDNGEMALRNLGVDSYTSDELDDGLAEQADRAANVCPTNAIRLTS